jgi:prepilin-type N-terminal cleavage/methylation domain-containing protein
VSNPRPSLRTSDGFTLIEVVMSLLVLSILMIAVEASLVASTKAIPDPTSITSAITAGASVTNRITGELAYALSVTEMTANAITFTVADRNGDGAPETIRYAWSGTAGDPLTRQYNGGTPVAIASSLRSLRLDYDKTSIPYYTYSEGDETTVYSFTNLLLAQDVSVKSDSCPGQYFVPSLPSSAVTWRVTRVKIRASKRSGGSGVTKVQLRTATPAGTPTNTILDEATMLEDNLDSNYFWVEFPFSTNAGLDPNKPYCIVLQWVSDAEAAQIQKNTLSLLSVAKYLKGKSDGTSWTTSGLDNMCIYVYGRPMQQNAVSYNYLLQNVRLSLQTSSNQKSAVATSLKLLNAPQVTGP